MYRKLLPGLIALLFAVSAWSAPRPNILLVYMDDVGPAWLPPYAHRLTEEDVEEFVVNYYDEQRSTLFSIDVDRHIETAQTAMPFLDSLARQGMVFEQAFATSSLCAPSRAGLMAGSYQQRFGIYGNNDAVENGFPVDQPMLVESLQDAGYATAMIGKWHLGRHDERIREKAKRELKSRQAGEKGFTLKAILDDMGYRSSSAEGQHPLDRGFDYYFGFNSHDDRYYGSKYLWENHELVPPRAKDEYLTDVLTDQAIAFMNRSIQAKEPFFVYYAPLSVHGPLQPSPEKYQQYFDSGVGFTDSYAGHMRGVDESLQRIYGVLEEQGVADKTLLIFSADNGQTHYSVPPYNAPYRGGKGTGWLGGSGVPLIVYMPSMIAPGFSFELISTMDILPTVLDIVGVTHDYAIDGLSFQDFLLGRAPRGPREVLYSAGLQSTEWSHGYDMEALKGDRSSCPLYAWALDRNGHILTHISTTPDKLYPEFPSGRPANRMFHSAAADPAQSSNLDAVADYSETVQVLDLQLGEWLDTLPPPLTTQKKAYRELRKITP